MTLLDRALATCWAIRPEALTAILALIEREDVSAAVIAAAMHGSPEAQQRALERLEAVSKRRGVPMDRTQSVTRRGTTAIVPVIGPIVRYGGMFTQISGGTSIETLAKDFTAALEDPGVEAILLEIDSPGGEANGVAEFADMIYAAREQKPVWAYVSDLGASAGYWIASAADEIVAAETASLGSIGVVAAVRDPSKAKQQSIEFVSSMSPNKRPDPTSEAGRSQIQTMVDSLGEIFVGAVARNRGVSTETVLSDFGAGGMFVGSHAVGAGLADRIGSFEGTLVELQALTRQRARERPSEDKPRRLRPAADDGTEPVAAQAFVADFQGVRASAETVTTVDSSVDLSTPGKEKRMSMRDRFFAWLDSEGAVASVADETRASADSPEEGPIVPEPQTVTELVAEEQQVPPAVSNRLAQLEAENARLRTARIMSEATHFADQIVAELRAMPAEKATLVALYSQLASDDERFGAIQTADGAICRVTLLKNIYAARPSRKDLTEEALGSAVSEVLMNRAAPKRSREDEEPGPERLAELLNKTPAGRQALAEAAAHSNGTAR